MTTRLPPRAYSYSPAYLAALPEPEPVPDAMFQFFDIVDTAAMLRAHLAPRTESGDASGDRISVGGETFVYYNPDNLNDKVSPDCYVAFDVDADAIVELNGYFIWLVGKPPDFVLEIASPSTARRDITRKRTLYARLGIGEYWRYDSTGGELYGRCLAGDRLAHGGYEPIAVLPQPDGEQRGYSPTLDLVVCGRPEHRLRFINPATGTYLRTLQEEQAALRANQAMLAENRAALAEERVARQSAEARVRQLERQLRELQSGPDPQPGL